MHTTRLALLLACAPVLLAAPGCERRDGQNAESGAPAATPAPARTSDNANAKANEPATALAPRDGEEAPAPAPAPALGADVSAWEGRRSGRVTFVATPEPAGFPAGAFRAATKVCLDETRAPADMTLELKLTSQGGRVRTVRSATASSDAAAPLPPGASASLVACLQRNYAKIQIAKAPEKFDASVHVTPAAD